MWFVERVAFLCFMDNFFFLLSLPLSLFACNGLSLPWSDTIHDFGGEGGGGGGCAQGRWRRRLSAVSCSRFCVNCQGLSANLEVAKVATRGLGVYLCDSRAENSDES